MGLSGGFGSLTLGHIWAASYNSVGAITDNSNYLGDSETTLRHGSVVSYAVSVENISIQADAVMNNGWGTRSTAATPAIAQHGDAPNHSLAAGKAKAEDKNVDEFHLGFSMGLGESGKIAFAHISHDTAADVKKKSNLIAGQYTIGSMTAYLGVAQHKTDDNTAGPDADGRTGLGGVDATTNLKQLRSQKDSTTFAGIRGSVGDTGLTYLFQARSKKTKGSSDVYTDNANTDSTSKLDTNKHTPWMMGLYRSLGGGATVMFEHGNPDQTGMKSTSHLALKIDF